jgi:hypothetical protein
VLQIQHMSIVGFGLVSNLIMNKAMLERIGIQLFRLDILNKALVLELRLVETLIVLSFIIFHGVHISGVRYINSVKV